MFSRFCETEEWSKNDFELRGQQIQCKLHDRVRNYVINEDF